MISLIHRYDISNDGQIDKKELTKLLTAMVEY
jgi:Ca2+-binding EF-hand superfamily protein